MKILVYLIGRYKLNLLIGEFMTKEDYLVGIYLRLSREDERLGESSSISNQRDLLLKYIKDNNLMFAGEYVDDGISGTTFDRKGFNQMIKDCENKKINMIITKDTSRLGRDHIEFGFYVERYFPEHGIRYVAVNDGIDTAVNSSANDMLVFKSAFNDMYVKDISNKLRSSLNIKKSNGQFVGTYAPYGYKKDSDNKHKLVIDEEAAFVVRRIFKMFAQGNSLSKICDTLTSEGVPTPSMYKNMNIGQVGYHYGVWSTRTVGDILKNPTYIGNLAQCRQKKINYKSKKRVHNKPQDWVIKENAVDPIVDEATFNLINRGKRSSMTDSLLLRGLIFCKDCNHSIGFRVQKQETKKHGIVTRVYGNCNYWAKRKKQNVCTPHSVKYDAIEAIVLDNLRGMCKKYLNENNLENILKNTGKLKKKKENLKHEILRIENNIEKIGKKMDACYDDKLEGNITLDMFKRIYNNLTLEIKELEKQKEAIKKSLSDMENNNTLESNYYMRKIKEFLEMKNPARAFIVSLIDRIEIDENKNIDIYYKFRLI